jgi:hypothetical protein
MCRTTEQVWTLSEDRRNVRFAIPPIPLVGIGEPLKLFLDFDAESVDAIIMRLTVLRSQMLPPSPAREKQN